MIKQELIKAYTIDQHPDKEAVFTWIRDNWHDLGDYAVNEFIDALKALANEVGGKLDYSVGLFPDRGEQISLSGYSMKALNQLKPDDLPLTGTYYDAPIIEAAQRGDIEEALGALHHEGDYIYSDEGLAELCEANQYYFTESGAFHS